MFPYNTPIGGGYALFSRYGSSMHATPRRQHNIPYLDGLRGLAALIVVMSHFAGAFYPAILFDRPEQVHLGIEHTVTTTPLGVLFAGNLAVRIFFVLSGFVLTYKYFYQYRRLDIVQAMLKRYIRLVIPIASSVLLAVLLARLRLFANVEVAQISSSTDWFGTFWQIDPSLGAAAGNAFIDILLYADSTYNPVAWTMHYELVGSLLVLAVVLLCGTSRLRYPIYAVLIVALFRTNYLAFMLGLVMADLIAQRPRITVSYRVWLPLLAAGVYAGSYPSYHTHIDGTIYAALSRLPRDIPQTIGALLIFMAVMVAAPIQRWLGTRPLHFLGQISFSLYLTHLILIGSLGSTLFLFNLRYVPYHAAFLGMLPPTMAVILGVAWLVYRAADEPAISLSHAFGRAVIGRFTAGRRPA